MIYCKYKKILKHLNLFSFYFHLKFSKHVSLYCPVKTFLSYGEAVACHLLHKTLSKHLLFWLKSASAGVSDEDDASISKHSFVTFFAQLEKWAIILTALLMFPQFLLLATVFPSTNSL